MIVAMHAALSSARLKPHPIDVVRLTPASASRQSAPRAAAIADSQTLLEAYTRPASPPGADVARRACDLIGRMTLKEKVGQMTQLEIGMVTDGKDAGLHINPAKLRKAIADYGSSRSTSWMLRWFAPGRGD